MTNKRSIIEISGLSKKYGKSLILDDINLDIPFGEITCIVGQNGSGKTTLIECIEGVIDYSGEIDYLYDYRRESGISFQSTSFIDNISVYKMYRLMAKLYSVKVKAKDDFKEFGLYESRKNNYKELSVGQQQKFSLMCAMLNKPKILFLDEPTTGLDPIAAKLIWEKIIEFIAGKNTVVLITHDLSEVIRYADCIVFIKDGKIIDSGSVKNVLSNKMLSKSSSLIKLQELYSHYYA